MITAAQLRAARGLLDWSQEKLASVSSVGVSTIRRMEGSQGVIRGTAENVWKTQRALGNAGVVFFEEDGLGGVGVRLVKEDRPPVRS